VAAAPAEKGFFGWIKNLFGGAEAPAPAPAAKEVKKDERGEGRQRGCDPAPAAIAAPRTRGPLKHPTVRRLLTHWLRRTPRRRPSTTHRVPERQPHALFANQPAGCQRSGPRLLLVRGRTRKVDQLLGLKQAHAASLIQSADVTQRQRAPGALTWIATPTIRRVLI
jgi:hypothetical protein